MKIYRKILFIILCLVFCDCFAFADNITDAEKLIEKAYNSESKEAGYEYIHKAMDLFNEEYEKNPQNITILLGLSKTYQFIKNRKNAKLYLLKAYNMNPSNPMLQKEMADFYYNFQEYSTAIEYYKLSLASGLLTDYETNLKTARCFDKLGDSENAQLYYQICKHINPQAEIEQYGISDKEKNKTDNNETIEISKLKSFINEDLLLNREEESARTIIEEINNIKLY